MLQHLTKKIGNPNLDVRDVEEEVTNFLAGIPVVQDRQAIAEPLYDMCMTELRTGRDALLSLAVTCARAAGKGEEALETLQAWFPNDAAIRVLRASSKGRRGMAIAA